MQSNTVIPAHAGTQRLAFLQTGTRIL